MELMEQGKLGIIDAIVDNSERREFIDFTNVYFDLDIVMITRDDMNFIRGLDDIAGKSLGTVKGDITVFSLQNDYPLLNPVLFDSASEGLKAVSNGLLDIFIIDIPVFEYYSVKSLLAKAGYINTEIS